MLVLVIKPGETICIGHGDQEVRVTLADGPKVRLAIDAPADCPIDRASVRASKVAEGKLRLGWRK